MKLDTILKLFTTLDGEEESETSTKFDMLHDIIGKLPMLDTDIFDLTLCFALNDVKPNTWKLYRGMSYPKRMPFLHKRLMSMASKLGVSQIILGGMQLKKDMRKDRHKWVGDDTKKLDFVQITDTRLLMALIIEKSLENFEADAKIKANTAKIDAEKKAMTKYNDLNHWEI